MAKVSCPAFEQPKTKGSESSPAVGVTTYEGAPGVWAEGDMIMHLYRAPNFVFRSALPTELESLKEGNSKGAAPYESARVEEWLRKLPGPVEVRSVSEFWKAGILAVVITRPFFPKFFAVFFCVLAVIWIMVVSLMSDPKQLSLNALGYFLVLWAIRAPLAATAPKTTTLLDDGILVLYALLVAVATAKFIWGFNRTNP